jgi:peptide/nickel transport system substrate-binding protein
VAVTGALLLAACSTPSDNATDDSGINQDSALAIAWEAPLNELNLSSMNGNATQNSVIAYMLNSGFNYYNSDLELVRDESFGTYEKVSDDPLTVKYTVNDNTTWSDGTPFDATDILLQWAGTSGVFNTVEAETDAEGNVTNQDAIDAGVYFDGTTPGVANITKTPEISDDGKSITFVYDKPFGDWELNFTYQFVPAHVVGQKSLDVAEAQAAKDALRKAIEDKDTAKLSAISKFWNSGFEFTSMPSDPSLVLTNGAYTLADYKENQYLTLKVNPDFKGERKASIDTITVRYIEDPLAQVQALENGEVQLIGPQASADVRAKLEGLSGIETRNDIEGTWEHVDLVFANKGPFDPATYGGDAAKALKVRQAFLLTIPRQTIIDNIIVPLNPEAKARNSFIIMPGAPGYDEMVKENGSDFYPDAGDIDKAKALLAEAGVTTPINVRLAYNKDNARRVSQLALIQDSAAKAGFTVVDTGRPAADWGTLLATGQDQYDASLFAWQNTSTAVTESDANYRTGGLNNYGQYSNPAVDAAFDKLAVETDPDKQFELQLEVEKILFADGFGTNIFQFPAIQAWSSNLSGVDPIKFNPTIFGGFWNWKLGS